MKNSTAGTTRRIEARKYLLVASGLAESWNRRALPRKKNDAGWRHPCAWMKKSAKAIRAIPSTITAQMKSRRGSSSRGRGMRDASDPATGRR